MSMNTKNTYMFGKNNVLKLGKLKYKIKKYVK